MPVQRSNGTSMISLILPPKSQISMAAKMLADEYGTASNIKSRVNRQSVLDAITSTQQRLKVRPVICLQPLLCRTGRARQRRLSDAVPLCSALQQCAAKRARHLLRHRADGRQQGEKDDDRL